MEEFNFKKELIKFLKESGVKLIGFATLLFGAQGIILLWCYAMISVTEKCPKYEKEIDIVGLLCLGYVIISFLVFVIKKFD